ncbi:hypothetical protein M1271_02535 [Patescibacteria group bacterium]|nr:hypothetical protein [Patescibacteria group bacterium]MCL5797442.1 hypothetical protein [Patescibacteria group bacterium]
MVDDETQVDEEATRIGHELRYPSRVVEIPHPDGVERMAATPVELDEGDFFEAISTQGKEQIHKGVYIVDEGGGNVTQYFVLSNDTVLKVEGRSSKAMDEAAFFDLPVAGEKVSAELRIGANIKKMVKADGNPGMQTVLQFTEMKPVVSMPAAPPPPQAPR